MTNKDIITVLGRALNLLDYRVIDHGKRVMYIVYKLLQIQDTYSTSKLHKICLLASLHDIGAFKTEYIDSLVDIQTAFAFELKDTLKHSVYGYLFLKNFSILGDFADAVLFHHFRYDVLMKTECQNKKLASMFFLADRVDILIAYGKSTIDENLFFEYRNTVFSADDIDNIIALEKEIGLIHMLSSGEYLQELESLYCDVALTDQELLSFLKTLSYIIDFRSEYTVLHNISTVQFSVEIAKHMGLSDEQIKKIYYGASLHDVGKIGCSVSLLEKTEKLDDIEYAAIKDHVALSEFILKGCVDDEILKIAVRHHEKLNGSGYPRGLKEKDLTISEQIVCIADILSALYGKRSYKEAFSTEKIHTILREMAEKNQISKSIVSIVIKNYDELIKKINISCIETIESYKRIGVQYKEICDKYSDIKE